jgi:hypothetical protein
MTRNEQEMYSNISSIAKSLEKIASVLEHMNHDSYLAKQEIPKFQDIPGFEGTKDALDNLCNIKEDENDIPCKIRQVNLTNWPIDGIINDSDYRIRLVASNYEDDYATKKDAILDYVESEFGSDGARYTDIIKFAYYLGAPNAPKYTSENRGYYSCAFNTRLNGHLIQGGKDYFVKGINKEGKERYFALSFVESATDYWKEIS